MKHRPFDLARLAILTTALGALASVAVAQHKTPPLPPARPSGLGAAPSAPTRSQPAPSAVETDRLPPIDPDHPPVLPQASRAQMRECGKEWQALKMAGKDEGGWRAFATQCLTR